MQPLVERREPLVHQGRKAVADRPEVGVPAGLLKPVDLCEHGRQLALVQGEQRVPLPPVEAGVPVHPGYGLSDYVALGRQHAYPRAYAPRRIRPARGGIAALLPPRAPAAPREPPVRDGRGGAGDACQKEDDLLHYAYHLTQEYFLILASGNPQLEHLWRRLWYELRPHLRHLMWTCFLVNPPIEVVPFTMARRPPVPAPLPRRRRDHDDVVAPHHDRAQLRLVLAGPLDRRVEQQVHVLVEPAQAAAYGPVAL